MKPTVHILNMTLVGAAILGVIDYKRTFGREFSTEQEKEVAYSQCHTRSAERLLRALLANGGACACICHCWVRSNMAIYRNLH